VRLGGAFPRHFSALAALAESNFELAREAKVAVGEIKVYLKGALLWSSLELFLALPWQAPLTAARVHAMYDRRCPGKHASLWIRLTLESLD